MTTQNESNQAVTRRFSKNVSVLLCGKVVYLATRLLLPPLVLGYVTLEEYGLWSATFVLIAYLGMGAVGVASVYVRYVAEYRARDEFDRINRLLSTGLMLLLGFGAAVLVTLWFALPLIISRLGVSPDLQKTAFTLMFGATAIFMLDLSLGAFAYLLHGLQRTTEQTLVWAASFFLEAVLIVVLLRQGWGIYALLWAFIARYILASICQVGLSFRLLPQLRLSWRLFDRTALKLFLGFGVTVQASSLLGMFLYSLEKLLTSFFLGASATGLLDIGEKLPIVASQLPATMNQAFLPTLAHLQTKGQHDAMRSLYLHGARYLNWMMGALMGFLAAFAVPLMAVWMGADAKFNIAASVLALMTLPYQLHELTGPATAIHRAVGKPRRELVYPLTQLALVLVSVTIGLTLIGKSLLVICGAGAVSMTLSALFYMGYTNRKLGVKQFDYLRGVLLPGLVPYLTGFAIAFLFQLHRQSAGESKLQALAMLGAAGLVYSGVMLLSAWRWLADESEQQWVKQQLQRAMSGLGILKEQTA